MNLKNLVKFYVQTWSIFAGPVTYYAYICICVDVHACRCTYMDVCRYACVFRYRISTGCEFSQLQMHFLVPAAEGPVHALKPVWAPSPLLENTKQPLPYQDYMPVNLLVLAGKRVLDSAATANILGDWYCCKYGMYWSAPQHAVSIGTNVATSICWANIGYQWLPVPCITTQCCTEKSSYWAATAALSIISTLLDESVIAQGPT